MIVYLIHKKLMYKIICFLKRQQEEVNMSEGGWTQIDFREIELGDQIGGGGVGVIYKGRRS